MKIRIIIADDHKIIRDGLRSLLEKQSDMEVIGESDNGRSLIRMAREMMPDVVVVDVGMPELNGIEATRQIVTALPTVRVIALSMRTDVDSVTSMFIAGAKAYLSKDCAFEELSQAVRVAMQGRVYLSPELAGPIMREYVEHVVSTRNGRGNVLTPREREVLQLIAEGQPTRQISESLCVSIKTIEFHRQQIMAKLGLNSIAELTKYAIREGLTSLDE